LATLWRLERGDGSADRGDLLADRLRAVRHEMDARDEAGELLGTEFTHADIARRALLKLAAEYGAVAKTRNSAMHGSCRGGASSKGLAAVASAQVGVAAPPDAPEEFFIGSSSGSTEGGGEPSEHDSDGESLCSSAPADRGSVGHDAASQVLFSAQECFGCTLQSGLGRWAFAACLADQIACQEGIVPHRGLEGPLAARGLEEVGKSGGEERHFGGKSGDEQRLFGLQALAAHVDGEAVCCTGGGDHLHEVEERLVGAPAVDAEPISSAGLWRESPAIEVLCGTMASARPSLDRSRDDGVDDLKASWADGLDDCTGLAVEEAGVEVAVVRSAVLVADGVVRVQAWWRGLRDRAAIRHAGTVSLCTRQWRSKKAVALLTCAARYDRSGRPWWRRLAQLDCCGELSAAMRARIAARSSAPSGSGSARAPLRRLS
jgi:hypothetical protein